MEKRFNLIDEPWIPVVDYGRVSLYEIFSRPELRALGGNPVQKIALTKLLLAVAQAAATPADDNQWLQMGSRGMAEQCLSYLTKWRDRFYLYGDAPFLQMPEISSAAIKPIGILLPEVNTGNTTVLTQSQEQRQLSNAELAVAIVVQMGFALSGKKTDNSIVLTTGYGGKKPSGKAGAAVGHMGLLHSFWLGKSLQHTCWLNLFTSEDIKDLVMYPELGTAPWENMPEGEDDAIARALQASLMGRLVPVGKFCLLTEQGIHYSDGVAHANYLEGKVDPTVSVDFSPKKPKALWVNPTKRPWRELTALLQFVEQNSSSGFETLQLKLTQKRVKQSSVEFAIWSGGLRVSSNAGEQYASGTDNYVESELWLSGDALNSLFVAQLKHEMSHLDGVSKLLWGGLVHYFRQLSDIDKSPSAKTQPFVTKQADKASSIFWQLCERHSQTLSDACDTTEEGLAQRQQLRRVFADNAWQVFDQLCPNSSARQMDAWAQSRPNFSKYLQTE